MICIVLLLLFWIYLQTHIYRTYPKDFVKGLSLIINLWIISLKCASKSSLPIERAVIFTSIINKPPTIGSWKYLAISNSASTICSRSTGKMDSNKIISVLMLRLSRSPKAPPNSQLLLNLGQTLLVDTLLLTSLYRFARKATIRRENQSSTMYTNYQDQHNFPG